MINVFKVFIFSPFSALTMSRSKLSPLLFFIATTTMKQFCIECIKEMKQCKAPFYIVADLSLSTVQQIPPLPPSVLPGDSGLYSLVPLLWIFIFFLQLDYTFPAV